MSQLIKYRGGVYRLAQDPKEKEFKYVGDEPGEGLGKQAPEERYKDPFDPRTLFPEEHGITPDEAYKIDENIPAALEDVWKTAEKLLQQYRITHQRDDIFPEQDGVDLVFSVNSKGTPNGTIVFDFTLSWFRGLKNLVTRPVGLPKQIQEIMFRFCQTDFAAHGDADAQGLLKSISILQNAPSSSAGAAEKLPAQDSEELDWLLGFILEMQENRPDVDIDYSSRTAVLKQFKKDVDGDRMAPAQYERAQKIISGLTDKAWTEIIKDLARGVKRREQFKPTNTEIQRLVQRLTQHEQYTGGTQTSIDPKTGKLVIALETPYPFRFILDWSPGKGVRFEEAQLAICEREYSARTEQQAKELLSALVDLNIAYNEAPNEQLSKDRGDSIEDPDAAKKEISDRLKEDPEGWLEEKGKRPPKDVGGQEKLLKEFQERIDKNPGLLVQLMKRNRPALERFFRNVPSAVEYVKKEHPTIETELRTNPDLDVLFE